MKKLFGFLRRQWSSYWVKSGFFALIGKSSGTIFGFLSFFILVRTFSPADFGTWTLYASVCGFLELWKAGFIGNPLIKYASGEEGDRYAQVVTSSLILNALLSLLQVGLLYVLAGTLSRFWDAPELEGLFDVYMISMVLLIFQSHFALVQQANLNFRGGFLTDLTRRMVTFTFLLVMFVGNIPFTLMQLAIVQLVGVILATFVAFFTGRSYHVFTFNINRDVLSKLTHFGKYTFGTTISSTVLSNIDSWMLGYFMSTSAVGLYNPAIKLSKLFELPTTTLTSVAFPQLVKRIKHEGPKSAKYLYEKSLGYVMAFMLPLVIIVIIFAEPIILLIAGEAYLESVNVLRVTMLYGLLVPFNRQVGATLVALGRARDTFLIVLKNMVINIILNYFFIKYFGLIGAAMATLITYVLAMVHNQYYINKLINVKFRRVGIYMWEAYRMVYVKLRKVV